MKDIRDLKHTRGERPEPHTPAETEEEREEIAAGRMAAWADRERVLDDIQRRAALALTAVTALHEERATKDPNYLKMQSPALYARIRTRLNTLHGSLIAPPNPRTTEHSARIMRDLNELLADVLMLHSREVEIGAKQIAKEAGLLTPEDDGA